MRYTDDGLAIKGLRNWRGLKSLVHEAVDTTTDLVDLGHESTMRSVRRVSDHIEPLRGPVRLVDGVRRFATRGVLTTIKGVNLAVEVVSDAVLAATERVSGEPPAGGPEEAVPLRSDAIQTSARAGDAALGLINGAVGDHLSENSNELDPSMVFRINDRCSRPRLPTSSTPCG